MTTKVEKSPNTAEKNDCRRLQEFKDFLAKNLKANGENNALTTSAITRSNNETYPIIATTELKAEITISLWNQLQLKQCPNNFQLGILRQLLSELEPESLKEHELGVSATLSNGKDVSPLQYDLAKLQKFVTNSLEKFLTRLTDNTEAQNLRSYADANSLCDNAEHCKCQTGDSFVEGTRKRFAVGAIKNKPRKMEDKAICLERFSELYELNKSCYSFYGVFDGHSGPLAASYATTQLPYILAKQLKETQPKTPDGYREAFETAFLETDKQFVEKNICSGTTAVCALIDETISNQRHLYVAWVGDSRALIVGTEASLQLVKSHKPDSAEERRRIEEAGGSVMFVQGQWRVNGFLNVARSIGDYAVGAVIAEPDFVDVPLSAAHDFIVLGSDGLFDHVSEAAIATTIYNALEDNEQLVADIPKKLIELAKEGDSQDNITAVIVFLKAPAEIVSNHRKHTN